MALAIAYAMRPCDKLMGLGFLSVLAVAIALAGMHSGGLAIGIMSGGAVWMLGGASLLFLHLVAPRMATDDAPGGEPEAIDASAHRG
ncbi:MAG: hypothetical protein AB7O57_02290 [Hyphomicrobiaceae bacterium]